MEGNSDGARGRCGAVRWVLRKQSWAGASVHVSVRCWRCALVRDVLSEEKEVTGLGHARVPIWPAGCIQTYLFDVAGQSSSAAMERQQALQTKKQMVME